MRATRWAIPSGSGFTKNLHGRAKARIQPAGAVLLQRADLMSRQDLWPWLACIYVRPQYRGLHIGAQLQLELCRYAAEHGFGRVYLYTDLINYYEKTGWIYAGQCVECDGSAKQLFYRDTEAAHDGR